MNLIFCVGCDCVIIRKEQVSNQILLYFSFGIEACKIKQPAVRSGVMVDPSLVSKACFKSEAKKIPKSAGTRTKSSFTRLCMLNGPDVLPSYCTVIFILIWKDQMRLCSFGGYPMLGRILNRPPQLTKSKAFVRSINAMYRSEERISFLLSICWRGSRTASFCNRTRPIRAYVLPTMLRREIPL